MLAEKKMRTMYWISAAQRQKLVEEQVMWTHGKIIHIIFCYYMSLAYCYLYPQIKS